MAPSNDKPWIKDREDHPLNKYEFEYNGYKCIIIFATNLFKHWNGYVIVPKKHPYYMADYSDIDSDIVVHGGLTYSSTDLKSEETTFGFDTSHIDDIVFDDNNEPHWSTKFATYKTYEYVEHQIRNVVDQLQKIAAERERKGM